MNGRGRGHGGGDQMGAPTRTLAAFKIAVARGGTTLLGLELVGIHGQTHGASRFAPLKPSGLENHIQAFSLGLLFDQTRTWNHQGELDVFGHFLPDLAAVFGARRGKATWKRELEQKGTKKTKETSFFCLFLRGTYLRVSQCVENR